MVPNGWHSKPLVQLLDKIIDYRGQSVPKSSSGIPLITARNVREGYLDFSNQEYVDESKFEEWMSRGTPQKGDILFTTEAPLGKACRFPSEGMYAVGQRTVTLRTNKKLDSEFLLYTILSERGQQLIDLRSSGSTAKGIKSSELKKVKITYPESLPEQRKIAKTLSTWDQAIATTERLIATSQQQKKALMQQLLTGKKRLVNPETGKEFEGDWEEVKLGQCSTCLDNKRVPLNSEQRADMQGLYPYWGANGIVDYVSEYLFDETIVLLAEDGGYFDEYETRPIANISYGKCWVNNHAHVLKAKKNVTNEWLHFSLVHKNILAFINGGTRAKLNKKDMHLIKILLPSIKEQQKIASVLTAADQEIELLEAKLAHLKDEKKALMQQLLTGKRRVKVDAAEVA